jgi:ATP-dependent phosphoenolpyruvate carboxykinase
VRERGGVAVASLREAASADLKGAAFVGVMCRDEELLPAVARLSPTLRPDEPRAYLLKEGRVGGTDPETSLEIRPEHMQAILAGIETDSIEWETDPDFGFEVAAEVPGIEGRDRFILIPRFLYARTERVYQYAARVPELREKLRGLTGAEPG